MTYEFYKAMQYPIPEHKAIFSMHHQDVSLENKEIKKEFSREKKDKLMSEYISHINKYAWLYKNLPGVREIYLCNSITFNALHKDSDIDLFIITKKNRLWRARLRCLLLFSITGNKRFGKNINKKFCLSFFVCESSMNLQSLRLKNGDIYLPFRIAHLVHLYTENTDNQKQIFEQNKWIKEYLPNHPLHQSIFIGNEIVTGKGKRKKIWENYIPTMVISLIQKIIKIIRYPIIWLKTQGMKTNREYIIVSDTIAKFHKDKRKHYYFLFKKNKKQ